MLEPDETAMVRQVKDLWNKMDTLMMAIQVAHRTNQAEWDIAQREITFGLRRLMRSIGTKDEEPKGFFSWLRQAE